MFSRCRIRITRSTRSERDRYSTLRETEPLKSGSIAGGGFKGVFGGGLVLPRARGFFSKARCRTGRRRGPANASRAAAVFTEAAREAAQFTLVTLSGRRLLPKSRTVVNDFRESREMKKE